MIYRVHKGHTVYWPDGAVRAEEGALFEGYDSGTPGPGLNHAAAILASYRDAIYPAQAADGESVLVEIPPNMGHPDWIAPTPAKKKRAASKPKATAKAKEASND